jgi:hypothetical protein
VHKDRRAASLQGQCAPALQPGACAPALQVFRCVGAWMCAHTPGKRVSLVRTAAAPPFHLPCPPPRAPSQFRTVGTKFAPNCPTDPTNFGLVFRSPQTLGVCGELMSNISATRGHPGMRICVCGSPRGDLSHIAGLTLGRSTERFSGANRRPQDHTCVGGVGLTQQIA